MIMSAAPSRARTHERPSIRLQTGDRLNCEELYERFSGRMLSVARRMLRTEEDAADAVHDAFLAAFASLDRFRAEAQISTWLHRIVVNQCLMRLRRQQRRPTVSMESLARPGVNDWSDWDLACESRDAAAEIEKAEDRAQVRRCIQLLPDSYREVLILRDIDEYDTGEAAAMLGVSSGAVKTRLHRARQSLLESLREARVVD